MVLNGKRLVIGAAIVFAVPALALGWWLLSSLITDIRDSDEFPLAANAVVPVNMTRANVERIMAEASRNDQHVAEYMPASLPAVDSEGRAYTSMRPMYSGAFQNADRQHKGSGKATVFQDANGSLILRLEDLEVTNGPDLHVLLTPHEDPESHVYLHEDGYVDLGKLKGNIGSQNYDIPDNTDVQSLSSLVIYCQPFHVIFSVATLRAER